MSLLTFLIDVFFVDVLGLVLITLSTWKVSEPSFTLSRKYSLLSVRVTLDSGAGNRYIYPQRISPPAAHVYLHFGCRTTGLGFLRR